MSFIEVKSILSKLRCDDPWFGITYNMNLYRGCQHGCIYCDTRSECYQIRDISQITVKQNALELLPGELRSKRKKKGTIGTGSMNDPYMPIEKTFKVTRKALQIIASEKFPVHVITKSNLVERDLDLLQTISHIYAAVSFTITSADDSLSARIEPGAPVTSLRFKAMEALASQGIYTGITLMPVLPFINDTPDNLRTLIQQAKDAGAAYILPYLGVTLRKGSRDYFYKMLEKDFPGLKARYQKAFGMQYECYSQAYNSLKAIFEETCDQAGMATRMRFYQPTTYIQQSLF